MSTRSTGRATVHGAGTPAGSAMAVPAFRRLWLAGLVSDAGDWSMFIALPLLVLQLTGSALGTSFAFLLELLPPALLAPVVARVVDRLPQQRLMVVAMLAQALTLLPLLAVRERADLPVVYLVIVAQATFGAVFAPAKNAVLPTLVGPDRTLSANALVGLNNDLGRIIGSPLGGVLLVAGGIQAVALVDVGTYVIAAVLVLSLPRGLGSTSRRPDRHRTRSGSGILHVLSEPTTRAPILVTVVASIAQGLFVVLFVFFVEDVIAGSEDDVGLLRGAQAIGAIAAGSLLGAMGARVNLRRLTLIGSVAFAALTALTWNLAFVTHSVPAYALLFAVLGAPAVLMSAGLTSLLQNATDGARRGSAFAALGLGQAVGQAVGLLAAGLLQERVGTMPLLEAQASLYGAAAVLALVLLPTSSTRRRPTERHARPGTATPARADPDPSRGTGSSRWPGGAFRRRRRTRTST